MLTLFEEPLTDNPSYFELAQYAKKDELYDALKKIGFPMPKSKQKPELMCNLVNIFTPQKIDKRLRTVSPIGCTYKLDDNINSCPINVPFASN